MPTKFGPSTLAVRNIPLPVALAFFNGKITNEGNLIYWQVSVEINTKKYAVERSCDGKNWKTVGIIEVKNSLNSTKEYSILDADPCEGLNYYKLLEFTGTDIREEYTVISLFNENTIKEDFQIFPNPNNGTFSVLIIGDEKLVYQMEMIDVLGKSVYKILL